MIPDYQTLIRPLPNYTSDGKQQLIGAMLDPLANELGLTEGEEDFFDENRTYWISWQQRLVK